jgi:hypothetical protein
MGDRKPYQFLRQLRSLVPDVPDDFLRSIWSSRLPPKGRAILAGQPEGDFGAAANCADRIIEAAPHPALASVAPLPDNNSFMQRIEDLTRQVAALSTELTRLRSSSRNPPSRARLHSTSRDFLHSSKKPRSGRRSPSRDDATSNLCWYHRRYEARPQKCTQPCAYRQQGKITQLTSTVAHGCATTQAASSSRTGLVNGNSLSTRVQTSACTPAGSFHDARNASTTTSAPLTALPSLLTDGCPSASTWG